MILENIDLEKMNNINKKQILITGASQGIGYSLSYNALNQGAIVYGTSRKIDKLRATNLYTHDAFVPLELDLTSAESIESLFQYFTSKNIFIDILINNAGIAYFKPFNELSPMEISKTVNVNLTNTAILTNFFLSKMVREKKGIIVNILSGAIERNFANSNIYTATKAAIRAMSRSIREEVRKDNVKILDVLVGATATEIWDKISLDKYSEQMIKPRDLSEIILSNINLSYVPNVMIEDIIIKPQHGDL